MRLAHWEDAHQGKRVGEPGFPTKGCAITTEREHGEMTLKLAIGKLVANLRNSRKLSVRNFANEIRYDYSTASKVETVGELASDPVMQQIDDFFDLNGALMNFVHVARKGEVQEYGRKAAAKEASAERVQVCTSSTIPALLQTPDYARTLIRLEHPKAPDSEIEEIVQARMVRKCFFSREDPAPYWAIMDESSLKRPMGDKVTVTEQLSHILKVAEGRNITLQVVPFNRGGYWMLGGNLTLITRPSGSTIAYIESFGSGELVESTKRVVKLTQQFDFLRHLALSESESLEPIKRYLEEYR